MFEDARLYTDQYKNGLKLSDLGAFLTSDTTMEFIPPVTIGTAPVLGREGSILCSRTLGPRRIQLAVHFSTEKLPTMSPFKLYSLDELDQLLSLIMTNNGRPIEIEFTDLPNRFYKCSFDTGNTPKFHIDDADVGYTLLGHDPWVYGVHNKFPVASGTVLPCDLEDSGEEVAPDITLEGVSKGTTISVTINGSVACRFTSQSSGLIYMKSEDREIEDSNGINLYPYITVGDYPILPAKRNSTIQVSGSFSKATIEFREKSLF